MNGPLPELPPIRAPWRRRWREFRIQVLPWIVFAGLVTVAAFLWEDALLPEPVQPRPVDCQPNCSDNPGAHRQNPMGAPATGSAALTASNYHNGSHGARD